MLAPRYLLALGAFFAFSLMPVFTREAGASILGVSAWRAVIVALVFGGWSAATEGGARALKPDRETLRLGAMYGAALALASSTFVGGYALTTVANTVFLHNLAPAAAFPLAWWAFKERPGASALTGAAVAVAGVAMLSGVSLFHFTNFTNPRFLMGDALALLSAVGYAAVLVLTRATRRAGTPILGTLFVAWSVAAVILVAVAGIWGELGISAGALAWTVGLAILCTNIPFYLLNLSMKEIPAGLGSVLSMSEVVFTTLVGMIVYGERLAPIGWIGGALVGVGVLYPLLAGDDEAEAESAPPPKLLSPAALKWRSGRLGLALMLFNGGAVIALLTGAGAGALAAWAGLARLLRLGTGPGVQLLEGRGQGALRWTLALIGAGLIGGLALRGGWRDPGEAPAVLMLVALALAADRALALQEPEGERDIAPASAAALSCLAAGQALIWVEHPAGAWLTALAAALATLEAWGIAVGALRGTLPGTPPQQVPAIQSLDRLPVALAARAAPLGLALYLAGGLHAIPVGHEAIVERLGFPLPDARPPGLLMRMPPPIERVVLVDVARIRDLALIGQDSPLLCGDQSMIAVEASLHYTVADAHAATYDQLDPEAALAALARSELVQAVSRRSQDEVLTTGRQALELEVQRRTQARADALGLQVAAVQIAAVSVPAPVQAAFLDVISADEERQTRINQAEAYAADLIPRVRGDAFARFEAAEGVSAELLAGSEALYERVVALSEGGAAAPALTRYRLEHEAASEALPAARLILSDPTIRVWLGGDAPRAAPEEEASP